MTDTIGIRELLWEWARAYPERAGDSVSWPRASAFGCEMASGHRENPEPINYERAKDTDDVVLMYLNAVRARKDQAKAQQELDVFWRRYHGRWELQDVAKRLDKSERWTIGICNLVEASIEMAYLIKLRGDK